MVFVLWNMNVALTFTAHLFCIKYTGILFHRFFQKMKWLPKSPKDTDGTIQPTFKTILKSLCLCFSSDFFNVKLILDYFTEVTCYKRSLLLSDYAQGSHCCSHVIQKSGVASNPSSAFLHNCVVLLFFVAYETKYLLIFTIHAIPNSSSWFTFLYRDMLF